MLPTEIKDLRTNISFTEIIKALSINLEKVGSLFIIFMALLLTIEIIGRNLLNFSTLIAYDLTGLLLGCMTFLGLAESFRSKTHIRVDFLTIHFSEKWKGISNLIACFMALIYAFFVLTYSWKLFYRSLQLKATTYSSLTFPLWPFQIIIPLGTLVFILVLVWHTISIVKTLRKTNGH